MASPFLNLSTFTEVILGLQSDNNHMRKECESICENFVALYPKESVGYLMQILKTEDNVPMRLSAAIYLKNSISTSGGKTDAWDKITPQDQLDLRNETFQAIGKESDKIVRKNLIGVMINIMELLPQNDEKDKFTAEIFNLFQSNQAVHQITALMILTDLIPMMYSYFKTNDFLSFSAIDRCLSSEDLSVRSECVNFLSKLLECQVISTKRASACVPVIMETLMAIKNNNPNDLEYFLYNLIGIADVGASFFKPYGAKVLSTLSSIALSADIDETVRPLALEVLLTMAETKPILARKIPNFIEVAIEITLHFMLDIIDEKYSEWLESGDESDIEENQLYFIGEQSIDRLAKAFYYEEQDAKVFPTIFRFLRDFLNRSEWHFNFVAIMSISQIAEYIPEDQTETYLAQIVQVLLSKLGDKEWRVRYAACHAIGQISLDHQPYVQENMHASVLPSLIKALNDSVPRVQGHALAAFINFAEEVTKSSLEPHVEYIMQYLFTKVINGASNLILEQAVSATAVIAGVIGKDFMKYREIIPYIISIMQQYTNTDQQTLRGKAVECSTIIGLSVGMEEFSQYSNIVMGDLIGFYFQDSSDDVFKEYVQLSINRMCRLMKQDFLPYIPKLLPSLLGTLSVTAEIPKDAEEYAENEEDIEKIRRSIAAYDAQTLDNQEYSLEFIKTCAEVLEIDFADNLTRCTEAIFPLITDPFTSSIKSRAISTMVYLIKVARKVYERNGDKTFVLAMVKTSFENIYRSIDESYYEEEGYMKHVDSEYFLPETSALEECLSEGGTGILTPEDVADITNKIFQLIQKSFKARLYNKSRLNELNKNDIEGDDDEDEFKDLTRENDQELDLSISLLDILGTLMRHHKNEFFMNSLGICIEFIQKCRELGTSSDNGLTLAAILLCSDMFDYLEEHMLPFWNDLLLPFAFGCIMNEDPRIRQPANYSLGKAAQSIHFRPYADKAAKQLFSATQTFRNNVKDESKSATDNAFTALSHLIFNHFEAIENPYMYIQEFINYLPLKDDDIEGKAVHQDLMDRFYANDPKLVGPEGSFKNKILLIFVEIYKTAFSTEELDLKIIHLFRELGQHTLESLFPKPTQQQINKLQTLMKDMSQNQQ